MGGEECPTFCLINGYLEGRYLIGNVVDNFSSSNDVMELEVAEMKILRFAKGITRLVKTITVYNRRNTKISKFEGIMR